MAPRLVAVSTRILRDRPVEELCGPLRAAGFGAMEICALPGHSESDDLAGRRRVAESCRRHGVKVLSLHAPYSAPVDITLVQRGERQQAVQEVLKAAEASSSLGSRFLVIHTGSEIDPEPYLQARVEALGESLRTIHTRCRELGVSLLLEEMEPHVFGGRDQDLRALLALSPRPFDGFCLDVAHAHLAGSLLERVKLLGPTLHLVHLGDARPGASTHEHLLPGQGTVPWPRLLEALDLQGPATPWVLEVDTSARDPHTAFSTARLALERVAAAKP